MTIKIKKADFEVKVDGSRSFGIMKDFDIKVANHYPGIKSKQGIMFVESLGIEEAITKYYGLKRSQVVLLEWES